jgi:hypothetical protein
MIVTMSGEKVASAQLPISLSTAAEWQVIAVSQTGDLLVAILGNPEIIAAYQAGVPGKGKPFPDGSKMAKIHWNMMKSAGAPAPTLVPAIRS